MRIGESVTFGGSGLERAAHLRGDAQAQARLLADRQAGVLALWRGKPAVERGDTARLCWLAPGHPVLAEAQEAPIFLGLDAGAPRFAVDVSAWQPEEMPDTLGAFFDPSEQRHPQMPEGAAFVELRGVMALLSARDAELAAMARALTGWHAAHRFCARCGGASVPAQAGWQRDCPRCGARHFPRTDPVVIMLVTRGNRVLLGRSHGWPEGMHSLLAGFVEPGEPIEGAVRREVAEETGVRVGRVTYLASQPWPFPSSLMIGCRGEAVSDAIRIDRAELEGAVWVGREALAAAFRGECSAIRPARRGSIANFLLWNWLADRLD
ncbi:NAD+ diphosphatase [Meinhardsimonia xiamenensis]|jgi:NAD+ diphosphatase|uniref:NAD(+) diphosphatase n=1 Tax=Meinhardsimonia xiamenensis TaxID=990712 RepID=A0A1G9CFR0_9RHOB|nr:NAD(+) diphosphatase [Meinhardsimonia xiamenensis]PRX38382.1 NAD+ diphosphatase [Meinhardsimonia xiamenensis]SDK50314.1 NAD+ diphosphatase [Meinhardsimonia xiamenensis]